MKHVTRLFCYLVVLMFLASNVSWGEQTDKEDSTPSSTTTNAKTTKKPDAEVKKKKEKSDEEEARKRAEQYLRYSAPGSKVKKGWVAGSVTYILPRYPRYHTPFYTPPRLFPPYYGPESNVSLKRTLEATRLWNQLSRDIPKPGSSQVAPVLLSVKSEPETKQVAQPKVTPAPKTVVGKITGIVVSTTHSGIVVRADDGKDHEYAVAKDATILRGSKDQPATEIAFSEVKIGDPIRLKVVGDQVIVLRVQYKTISGKVVAVAKDTVLLDSGETFKVTSATTMHWVDQPEQKVELKHLTPQSTVKARLNPVSGEAVLVELIMMAFDTDSPPVIRETDTEEWTSPLY